MFAIFLRFALNVLADSIAVSKFVNIDRVLQIQNEHQTFWYWDEMACQWLGCFFQELQLCFKEQLTRMPFYIASGSY